MELTQSPDFNGDFIRSSPNRACFNTPNSKLADGTWYWRVNAVNGTKRIFGKTNRFRIDRTVPVFVAPTVETLVKNLPKQRPYMLAFGRPHRDVMATARKYPELVEEIRKKGEAAYKLKFEDPDLIPPPAEIGLSAWLGRYSRQVRVLHDLCMAYLVTGEDKYYEMGKKRIEQNLNIKTLNGGMETAERARLLAIAYDTFYNRLDPELKKRILDKIQEQLAKQYSWWPGDKESLFLENHFWQVELSGFFISALATVADCPENLKYLEYAYGIFLTRAPVAGGNDGGWANGLPYFTVNDSTVGDMAYYLYTLGKVDIYQKPWYRNLPDYYIHCGFPGAPMDGFGNMHDRAYMNLKENGIGWNFGTNVCGYIAAATGNEKALFYLSQVPKQRNLMLDLFLGRKFDYDPAKFDRSSVDQARVFREVGIMSMHTNVLEPKNDMAVYFRSSPFGTYGHAHANQNSFNIAYRGERVFYPTGYYTDFADVHALADYRHTRGHNTILADGKGQTYGPEGFGWLKRYLHGERISYVCGAAPNAYVPVVNRMWSNLVKKIYTPEQQQKLFGDAGLKKFDRHLVFLRPNIVVVYDELEAEKAHNWTFQLHTYLKPEKTGADAIRYEYQTGAAQACIFASSPVTTTIDDQFAFDPRPLNPRYRNAKNQYHIRTTSNGKSDKMRFLAIIQCADTTRKLEKIVEKGDGLWEIGGCAIRASLSPSEPAGLTVSGNGFRLVVTPENTTLEEQTNGKSIRRSIRDQPPRLSYGD